jgi:excisionase family DNA binding protein
MENVWLTRFEAAAYLKVSRATLDRLLAQKKIPAYKVGRLWRFNQIELDQWIEARKNG